MRRNEMSREEAVWLNKHFPIQKNEYGRFVVLDECLEPITEKTFATHRNAVAYRYMVSKFGKRDRAERCRWWKEHPQFFNAVKQLIHEAPHQNNSDKLTMRDVYHQTKALAKSMHVIGYKIGYWNYLVKSQRGNFLKWYTEKFGDPFDINLFG